MASSEVDRNSQHNQVIDLNLTLVDDENHNEREIHGVIVSRVDGGLQLKLGMMVHSENEAYDLYNEYALHKGFSVRRDKIRYKCGTKEVSGRNFVCSKQGFHDCDSFEEKKVSRLETRTGCKAFMTFKVENGIWEVIRFNDDHNHEFALPEQRHLLRSGRSLSNATKDVVDSLHDAGIGPIKAHEFLALEFCGYQNVPATKRDIQNYVNRTRMNLFEAGDAQALLNHFKDKQAADPMFFYLPQLDDQNRLTNIFWRDAMSKFDYDCFGDVVVFYTTFRTNTYNMICAPFIGINHHWQNISFGCAFLLDETIPSFVWLFETFKALMGNKQPKIISTDQDATMANAISRVFPDTCHRLCTWHIQKNAASNIPHLYGKPGFKKKFYNFFSGYETEEEFEHNWRIMIEEWGLQGNSWLISLYKNRRKWSPVFSHDIFL